ncbi:MULTISPECIES: aminotransferase class III-fold pyridoxal phosphate-dependent enzyme [Rhizobium/Agrobacterium group]|uniref:Aminotransferase class III-fold pyridoxal phosphate-dependent enzyme n=1 Tax=Agrobacterium cucumeris TaxID=2862866 RepID=A0ABY8RXE6_9HYPH|nr:MULTISPECIES: aminotransferase class III-fold pyridoxal phosphate-dependent enzyme [Rhizobium/Agrobacterium group]MCZ7472697.1 aminotransferase class III-fold pyridoxal phosphate-dependent enzyme [Rhizobium rhizogenes]MCZ7484148.1 aminotransferase class III-fold pyridoxal phosphate-dependent enzyme [Rhizobium rhizogenes]WHO11642.1 aminotransferase class III-fold pyridoxal phosphate-dependent enzyme [Agrobacterium cucumeris]
MNDIPFSHNPSLNANASRFWHPMQSPFELAEQPPLEIVEGQGVHVVDSRGRRLLDATAGGLSNVTLGYSAAPIKEAIARQLEKLPYFSSFRGNTNKPAEELAGKLIDEWFRDDGMARVFFTSGGSDAVDTAMRLSRQYWKITGAGDRYKFIAMRNGYHGTHFGGASLNSRPAIRRAYEPLLAGCFHIPVPLPFRNPFGEADPERLTTLCISMLEEEIQFQGGDTVAAIIVEPVSGAGGLVVPPPRFWPELRRVCDKYGILLVADEVITGFGRTGDDSGSRGWGVKPDIMCLAKAISSGYFPLGAALVNDRIASAFEQDNGPIGIVGHGYTYSGSPVGCAAAIATLDMYRNLGTTQLSRENGQALVAGLEALKPVCPWIGDVRGKGLMACVEMVAEPGTNMNANPHMMMAIGDATAEAGVLIRVNGSQLLITPPLIVTREEVETIVDAVRQALAQISN